jgi:hypothetical protein
VPVAAQVFGRTFLRDSTAAEVVHWFGFSSPFAAVFSLPLVVDDAVEAAPASIEIFAGFLGFAMVYNLALLLGMIWLFQARWRVSE